MQNPWTRLPSESPYVLAEDAGEVEAFNGRLKRPDELAAHKLQLQLIPDPYIGRLEAPLVLFTLNPGYTPPKVGASSLATFSDDWWHANSPELRRCYQKNFAQEDMAYPFFFLNPIFRNNPGGAYWTKHLRELIELCDAKTLSKNLLTVEFFPYHSLRFRAGCKVPSMTFARHLIRSAIERESTIVIVRKVKELLGEVPELASYPYIAVNSAQGGYISRGNVPEFERLVRAVKGH